MQEITQEKFKRDYVKASILLHESQFLVNASNTLNTEDNAKSQLVLFTCIKYNFIALKNIHDSKCDFNIYNTDNEELNKLSKALNPYLEFATHVRNLVSGHLDNGIIDNAVQWEPFIFAKGLEKHESNNKEIQLIIIYRTLLESAINSYVDKDGRQKQFGEELDLNIPQYSSMLLDYMNSANDASFAYLTELTHYLNDKIEYIEDLSGLFNAMQLAANTDFSNYKK